MPTFKVHSGDPGKHYKATLEDMGLCYVSKITVLGVPFYSVCDRELADKDLNVRVNEDIQTMREHGFTFIEDSIQ